jgi:DNA polymerase I-like protein with 3'-5' exonuclease and polymerase domains
MNDGITTLDFETDAIAPWPNYPPKPVGLAVRYPDGRQEYIGWGHPKGNNGTREQAEKVLRHAWNKPVLFHNSAFDIEVAMKEFGLPYPKYVHDTLFSLFLFDPHADSLSLKPSANRILQIAPEEQRDLENYIRANVRGGNVKEWGAFIGQAPGNIVAPYAIGDVERTYRLHEFLLPIIDKESMRRSYDLELRLQPILMEATRRGIRVNVDLLAEHIGQYEACLTAADIMIRNKLGVKELNIDSNEELADALERAGMASGWLLTPKGKRSTSKESLKVALKSQEMVQLLAYRNSLMTCLTTFMRPWMRQAEHGGRCHPSWNQVRGATFGARTGRLSSNGPNFQNVPNEFEGIETPIGLLALPQLRDYLLPEVGMEWFKRDYSQQELRVLAHFEDGALLRAYQANPRMDVHDYAKDLILQYTGHEFKRKQTKIVSFTLVYGGGIPALSAKLESSAQEAAILKESYLASMPDVRSLMNDVKARGRAKQPVRTTGGRLIYAEKTKDGRDQSYKLLNHLIQGSSADITKESIVNWDDTKTNGDLFLATVHDENNGCCPIGESRRALREMGEAMLAVKLDVPLLSEGFVGPSWGKVKKVNEEGERYV